MSTEGIGLPPPRDSFITPFGYTATPDPAANATSLEKSQKSAQEHIRDPAVPIVIPYGIQTMPTVKFSAEDLKQLSIEFQSTCVNKMWSQFNQQMNNLSDANRETRRKVDLEQIRVGLDQLLKTASARDAAIQGVNEGQPMIGVSMLGAFSIMATAGGVSVPGMVTMEGVADAFAATLDIVSGNELKILWSFLGPALATSVFTPAALSTFRGSDTKEGKVDLKEFVKDYVQVIKKLVSNPLFGDIIAKLIPQELIHQLNAMSNKTFSQFFPQLMSMLKLTLLFTALGSYYKYETGHLTGKEILDLIHQPDKFNLKENDPRRELINTIQLYLVDLKGYQKKYLEKIFQYFDGNPSFEDIFSAITLMQQSHHIALRPELKG